MHRGIPIAGRYISVQQKQHFYEADIGNNNDGRYNNGCTCSGF
jgi:hypothetical protein